jgi:anti-sigma regulatory factor (Ser/Thr protein kinase)
MSADLTFGDIQISKNKISFSGNIQNSQLRNTLNLLFILVKKQGWQDIILDFENADEIFIGFIVPFIAAIRSYEDINFILKEPKNHKLNKIFQFANWSYLISPRLNDPYEKFHENHLPCLQYSNRESQEEIANRILDMLIKSSLDLNREKLKALEWSLYEVMDNVLNHAESPVGGYLQAVTYPRKNVVEFVVADAGIGIPKSLNFKDHRDAVEQAIREGITRNKQTNQGNGLFGTYQVATQSGGTFELWSYYGRIYAGINSATQEKFSEVQKTQYPYPGTFVRCRIDCSNAELLKNALKFNNQPHDPAFDYIERKFMSNNNFITLNMIHEFKAFGSREAGITARNEIEKLLKSLESNNKLLIDFSGVTVISSSFADEVFGKIFAKLGPLNFINRIEFINTNSTIQQLIDRAITLRLTESTRK